MIEEAKGNLVEKDEDETPTSINVKDL